MGMIRDQRDRHEYIQFPFPLWSLCLLCGLCVSAFSASAQTLYKCVLPNGKVAYQQEPCVDAKQSTVRRPDPVASKTEEQLKAAEESAAKEVALGKSRIAQIMGDTTLCMTEVPSFEQRHTKALQAWSARHREAVKQFDGDEKSRAEADARIESERARHKASKDPKSLERYCDSFVASLSPGPAAAPKK